MSFFPQAVLFLTGLAVGSFLNVVVYRVLHGFSPFSGRSFCPHCHKKISWYDNIPLVSFVTLRGRCRRCHKNISLRYPVIELLTANLFVWWYVIGELAFKLVEQPYKTIQPLYWLLTGIGLVLLVGFDVFYGILPDWVVGGMGMMTLVYRLALSGAGIMRWQDLGAYILTGITASVLLTGIVLITRGRGMGWGDVKFAGVMGIILGWPKILVAMMVAVLTGAGVALILVWGGKKKWGQTIPFGPFLVEGTVVALVWGEKVWQWYAALLGLPF